MKTVLPIALALMLATALIPAACAGTSEPAMEDPMAAAVTLVPLPVPPEAVPGAPDEAAGGDPETPIEGGPEAVLAQLTLRQKVGQMFLIRPERLVIRSKRTADNFVSVTDAMRESYGRYPVGGYVLFAANIDTPEQLKAYVRDLGSLGGIAPIFSVDEEGGRVLRMGSNDAFNLERMSSMGDVGSSANAADARDAGAYLGNYLRRFGFNLDLAPVADARTNPSNTVIGNRAFGSSPEQVSEMVAAFIEGMHGEGVGTCIKHFPGHGGTAGDTHEGFVALEKTWDALL